MKRVIPNFTKNLYAENVRGILERQWSSKRSYAVETVWEFTYLGDRVGVGGGCEAAVTARTRCGWVNLRECGELLFGRFPLRLKGAVHSSYVRPAIVYGSEKVCLK